jgi:uncharacterized protein YndB with AHSA1/START domain
MTRTEEDRSHTVTIEVAKSPHHVFECIRDVSKWWGGKDLKGNTRQLNDEFTITHGDSHYSKQKIMEVVPDQKIVWRITEGRLGWLERDKSEWTDTNLVFELAPRGDRTVIRFTHEGLVLDKECYSRCSEGWNLVIERYLFKFITDGTPHFS